MGTLRSSQVIENEDGTFTPAVKGHAYNGVTLGEPVELDGDPATFEFDDSAFPNGTVELVDGELVVAVDEEDM